MRLDDPPSLIRYDELGASEDDADDDEALDDLGPWRSIKVPFTAFRDRGFYQRAEHISVVYLLLAGESPGPFALEIGEVKAGRCEKAHLDGAGQCTPSSRGCIRILTLSLTLFDERRRGQSAVG